MSMTTIGYRLCVRLALTDEEEGGREMQMGDHTTSKTMRFREGRGEFSIKMLCLDRRGWS